MQFNTKFAVVLRDDLQPWQELNVTAYVASAIVGQHPEIVGEDYRDASGNIYLPMIIQPVIIFQADGAQLRTAYERAMKRESDLAIYTMELFSTGNDSDNRAAVSAKAYDQLDLVGIALHDKKKVVDKVTKGLKLHP